MQNLLMRPQLALALMIALVLPGAPAAASGPGLGNFSYAPGERLQPIATLHSPRGHGLVAMLDGYLFVPFSNDGNLGAGGFDLFSVNDPRSPALVSRTSNAATEPLIEPHLFGFHVTASATYLAYPTRSGISIWDVSDPQEPTLVSSLALPGLGSSGYDGIP